MRLLLFILPTLLLTSYGQLITKWRVAGLLAAQTTVLTPLQRLFLYLTDPYIISAYGCALLASFAWLYAVEQYPVSVIFPVYTGLLFTAVILLSAVMLHETISPQQVVGALVIFAGIVIVSRA